MPRGKHRRRKTLRDAEAASSRAEELRNAIAKEQAALEQAERDLAALDAVVAEIVDLREKLAAASLDEISALRMEIGIVATEVAELSRTERRERRKRDHLIRAITDGGGLEGLGFDAIEEIYREIYGEKITLVTGPGQRKFSPEVVRAIQRARRERS